MTRARLWNHPVWVMAVHHGGGSISRRVLTPEPRLRTGIPAGLTSRILATEPEVPSAMAWDWLPASMR